MHACMHGGLGSASAQVSPLTDLISIDLTSLPQAKKVTKQMSLKGSGHLSEDEESQLLTPSKQPLSNVTSEESGSESPWSATVAKLTLKSVDRR